MEPTPLQEEPELAKALGLERLFIKREDENPSGSHKDRAIWPMFKYYMGQGRQNFVISSSGNAAISACHFVTVDLRRLNADRRGQVQLHVFVSPNMPANKRSRLENIIYAESHRPQKGAIAQKCDNIILHESHQAKSAAIKFARENNYQLIRTSTDALALEGYRELASELVSQVNHLKLNISEFDVFAPTSSGATVQGLYEGFRKLQVTSYKLQVPRFHIVQTAKCAVIAREFDRDFESAESSLASAIVDTIGHRKDQVVKAVKESGGSGWAISDEELKGARELFENNPPQPPLSIRGFVAGVSGKGGVSWDPLLSLAGLQKALRQGFEIKNAILLFMGK